MEGVNLASHCQEKAVVSNELRRRVLSQEWRLLEQLIDELVNDRKTLEASVSACWKDFKEEKKKLKKLWNDKGKDDRPV